MDSLHLSESAIESSNMIIKEGIEGRDFDGSKEAESNLTGTFHEVKIYECRRRCFFERADIER